MNTNSEPLPLIVGHVYESKTPRVTTKGLVNDRWIIWIGADTLQYDSPTVRYGQNFPKVTHAQFREWAGRDITDEMPKYEWREAEAIR
jgi:hypothetical protein